MLTDSASTRTRAEAQFQNAYSRFLTDERFRQSVLASSADTSVCGLSDGDFRRLRAMDQDRVELFAKCLFGNRIAAITEAFPLSVKMIAAGLPALVQALDAQDVAIDTRKYPEAERFANFVLNIGGADALALPDSVLGLLHYEFTILNLRVRPRLPAWPDGTIRSSDALAPAIERTEDVRLVLNRNHALLSVGFDVDALRELAPDTAPSEQIERDTIVLLHRGDNGIVNQMGLNHASAAAILMIDGMQTFRALISRYAAWLGRESGDGLEEELKELCVSLYDCGALGFASALGKTGDPPRRLAGEAA